MKFTHTFADGEKVTRGGVNTCLCHSCRQVFNSVAAFDRHRKGGKCSTEGMFKNAHGYWVASKMDEATLNRIKDA